MKLAFIVKMCGVWKMKKMSLRPVWNLIRVTHGDGVGGTPQLQARTAPVSSYLETTMQLNLSCTAAKTIWRKLERKQVAYSSGQNRKTTAVQPHPIRPNSREARSWNASDEKRISWNNLDLSKGRKTVSPNVSFQEFSSYGVRFSQPAVPEKF